MAPSIVENLIAYQLYKPSEDVAPVQRKSKANRRRRGKRAGRRVQARRERCVLQGGDHCIPVISIVRNNNRIKRPRNNQYLTRVVTAGYSVPMPTLRPYSPDNPVDHLPSKFPSLSKTCNAECQDISSKPDSLQRPVPNQQG